MTKRLHSEQAKAFAEWWTDDPDCSYHYELEKRAFFAGWQASKADSHNHKVVVEYDLAPALIESRLHDKLLELGYVLTKRTTE